MTHLSENSQTLKINHITIIDPTDLIEQANGFDDVCLVVLPPKNKGGCSCLPELENIISKIPDKLGARAILVTLGEPIDLVHIHAAVRSVHYQLWISIKRQTVKFTKKSLPEFHFGALLHTRYKGTLKHTITRIKYSYCPACDKTTKDYGGKKHTYNSYGTLISDIWRDIACDLAGDLTLVFERFADLFGLEEYQELRVLDCRNFGQEGEGRIAERNESNYIIQPALAPPDNSTIKGNGQLLLGDCLEQLRQLPTNSVDFAFVDPPYNLGKKYNSYSDELSIKEYFTWCDEWISELSRIIRPGHTLAVLNIPLWAIRHFLHMETILDFQNWIAWDALSFPVRKIMPAHYAIVCFSKGASRPLPGLTNDAEIAPIQRNLKVALPLEPMAEWYCLRASCIRKRNALGFTDRGQLTDLWGDIHRLKHNSRRVDHPCQLPPQLLYRLISIFTKPDEVVLDCFNGAGTTTLAAHQLGRRYIGIEFSEKYYEIATLRHEEIQQGLDPFRKEQRKLTEKNSRVARVPKRAYEVPKKTLQLEVRRVSQMIGQLPSRDDMIKYGKYPIKYYDEYFASWGEVCAAARHDGMSEIRENNAEKGSRTEDLPNQLSLFSRGVLDAKR